MATERTVLVRLKANVNDFVAGMSTAAAAVKGLTNEIDTTNQRGAWLAQGFLALAPALVPIGAVAIPAVTTLATQMGLAAAAAGVGLLAFQGVGNALKALSNYQLAPTAANLKLMQVAMEKIGPAGANFVNFINDLKPKLTELQDAARGHLFPGLEDGITSLTSRLPEVKSIITDIASAMGDLASQAGDALAGPKFDSFFQFLQDRSRGLLTELGQTIGNFIQGLAAMASAFEPLTVTFSAGFLKMSQSFADWANGLSTSSSFNDFVNYATAALPKVVDLIKSLANLFIQLAEAAAPVGDVMLPALTDLLNVFAKLADTPLGSMFIALAAAVSIYGRAVALTEITTGGAVSKLLGFQGGLLATSRAALTAAPSLRQFAAAAAASATGMGSMVGKGGANFATFNRGVATAAGAVGLLALSMSNLDDKAGLANTSMGALTGLVIAGPLGAAIGTTIGFIKDATSSNDDFAGSLDHLHAVMQQTPTDFRAQQAALDAARKSADAYKASVIDLSGNPLDVLKQEFQNPLKALSPGSLKNSVEDIFGGSEVQDQAGALRDAAAALATYKDSWSGLINALQHNGNPFAKQTDYTKNLGQLAKYAQSIQPALDALHLNVTDLGPSSYNYQKNVDAIQKWLAAQDSIPGRQHAVASAVAGLSDELLSTADSADSLATALDALFGPGLDKEQAIDAAIQKLHEMKKALDDNAKTFQGSGADALENRAVTRDVIQADIAAIAARAKAGDSMKSIVGYLKQSRKGFIDEGVAAGFSRDQMVARANALGLTPKLVRTIVKTVGAQEADATFHHLLASIRKLPPKVRTALETHGYDLSKKQIEDLKKKYDLTPKQVQTLLNAKDQASKILKFVQDKADHLNKTNPSPTITALDHATLTINGVSYRLDQLDGKTAHTYVVTTYLNKRGGVTSSAGGHSAPDVATGATGGYIRGPGTPTSDSIPLWGSDGEYMVRAAAVAKYGVNMMHRINAMQFAAGGYVNRSGAAPVRPEAPTVAVESTVRIRGPVEIRGRVDLDTGRLIGTMEVIAGRAVDDAAAFHRTQGGRRS